MLDFDADLHRIGRYPADQPTWQAVHRVHATTIPFENLDCRRGLPISAEQADIERKARCQSSGRILLRAPR
jgi:arylamine N-acetyltransferase